jgi:hypothetical protein
MFNGFGRLLIEKIICKQIIKYLPSQQRMKYDKSTDHESDDISQDTAEPSYHRVIKI